ncbi:MULTISPECIES: hypothetical protein, partial [unclassified Novosphingobium]|uniref:hypothetical protein n=1 Tax=unclassified Novosphingobium TaxID=2644732 RepID=UPI001F1A6892
FNPQTSITLKSGSSPAMTLRARRLPKIQILACADQHDEFSGLGTRGEAVSFEKLRKGAL